METKSIQNLDIVAPEYILTFFSSSKSPASILLTADWKVKYWTTKIAKDIPSPRDSQNKGSWGKLKSNVPFWDDKKTNAKNGRGMAMRISTFLSKVWYIFLKLLFSKIFLFNYNFHIRTGRF